MNQSISIQELNLLLNGTLGRNVFIESQIWSLVYSHAPYFIALPQAFMNFCVVFILILAFTSCKQTFIPGLVFLLNLGLADLIHAIILWVLVKKYNSEDFIGKGAILFANHETSVCKIKASLLFFVYIQSMMSTVFLTLDRYLTIAYLTNYNEIMTKRKVSFCIALCWAIPISIGISTGMMVGPEVEDQETVNSCAITHLGSKAPTTVLLILMTLILIIIYVLYFRILFSFWRLRRKQSRIKLGQKTNQRKLSFYIVANENTTKFVVVKFGIFPIKQSALYQAKEDAFDDITMVSRRDKIKNQKSIVYDNLHRLSRYIKASKYVLVILLLFTICWLPWMLAYTTDIIYHYTNYHHQAVLDSCGKFNATTVKKGKYQPDIYLCVRNLFGHNPTTFQMEFPSDSEEDKCGILYEILHERMFENIQLLVICLGALNSLFNPIVYAIWCDVFRRIIKQVATHFRRLFENQI